MKIPKLFLLLCALAFPFTARCADTSTAGNSSATTEDIAFFSDGDILRGSLTGGDKAGLRWSSAYGGQSIVLPLKYLSEIQLHPRAIPAKAMQPAYDVLLANGDLLPGLIVSFDGKSLVLDTWYAGRLAIPLAMVKNIIALDAFGYKGPAGMDGWVTGTPAGHESTWSCKDGILSNTGAGTIGRDMKLKAPARIQFDLTVSSDSVKTIIYIGSSQLDKPGDSYMFQINAVTATVDAARYSPGSANVKIGQPAQLDLGTADRSLPGGAAVPEKCHFEIFVNKETKTIWLYANGSLVEQYTNLDDLPKMGGGLVFAPDGDSPMEITRIKESAWEGGLDEAASADPGANEDSITAANHVTMHGKLKSIADGKVVFTCSDGDHEIQAGDIGVIRFSAAAADQPKTGANDVRVLLLAQGRVTMEIESWNAKGVTVTSPDFGSAVFSPEAFRYMSFNIQDQPLPEGAYTIDTDDGGDDD